MALQEVVKEHLTPKEEGDSDSDSEYIQEDRETEIRRTNTVARQIQQRILQELQTTVGGAQALPDAAAKDLVLQVSIFIYENFMSFVDLTLAFTFSTIYDICTLLSRVSIASGLDVNYRLQPLIIRKRVFPEYMWPVPEPILSASSISLKTCLER